MSRSGSGYLRAKPSTSTSTDELVQLWHHRDMDARKKELKARAASRDARARATRRAEQERDLSDADIQRRRDQIYSDMQQLWGKGSHPHSADCTAQHAQRRLRMHSAGPKDRRTLRELLPEAAQELPESVKIGSPEAASPSPEAARRPPSPEAVRRLPSPEAARRERRRAAAERGHALPPRPEAAQRPPSPEAVRRLPSPEPAQRSPSPEPAQRLTSTEVVRRSPPRRPSAAFAGSEIFAPEVMHALNQPFLNAQEDAVIRTFTRNVQRSAQRARSADRQRLQSNADRRLRKDSHAATMANLRQELDDEQYKVRLLSRGQDHPFNQTSTLTHPPAPDRMPAALAVLSDGKLTFRLLRCAQVRQRKLKAIDTKLQRASVVSTAVDEDKSTRVLREKETVSWAPSSPSRPSLVLGASVERCAPHLGMHAVIRPGSRGSLARTDSSLLVHSSGCEPHLARRPSTSEPPTLRGNPTLRGSSIGRFDGAGFVTPTVAFRGSSAARSTGGLGAAQFL